VLDRSYANFSELRKAEVRRIYLPRTPMNRAVRDPPYTLAASAFVALLAELWAPTSVILFEILTGQWRVGR
jgi:hypothetical protein